MPINWIANHVKLCHAMGRVIEDSFKKSLVMHDNDKNAFWIETYKGIDYGTWFNYPAKGIQIRVD
jgi:hypothetical protein